MEKAKEIVSKELQSRHNARNHLLPFIKYTFPDYKIGNMHRIICDEFERVERGETTRLMIFTPPRHGKSEISSKRFPAWFLGRNPNRQIISASYSSDLAGDFGREVRNIVDDSKFRVLFPHVSLARDSSAKDRWHTSVGGSYVAAGVNTATTGRGADILNIDDPVKDRAEAESESTQRRIWDWYRSTAYTRLMPGGRIILTMTRWHPKDLAGKLLEEQENGGDKWRVINMPAFNEHQKALWPERYDENALTQIRNAIGEREFGALYMQNPKVDGSAFFDISNVLSDNKPIDIKGPIDAVFATIDTAIKTGKKNDGTAVCIWGVHKSWPHHLTLLDWDIIQVEGSLLEAWIPNIFDSLNEYAGKLRAVYGSLGAFIEDKTSGSILIQQCKRRGKPVHPIDSKLTAAGKDERAISVSGYVQRKLVRISEHAYYKNTSYKGANANHFVKQVFDFRIGVPDQQDDLLDCFTYGIAIALGNEKGF